MNSISVDIGGTFTDAYIRYESGEVTVRTPTTVHDLSIGFIKAIEDGAKRLEIPITNLLGRTDVVCYATTVAMNKLIERSGVRLGLITTAGFEDTTFIGRGSQWQDGLPTRIKRNIPRATKPEPIVPRNLVVGVRERMDSFGNPVIALDEEDAREKVRYLADQKVRGVAVCFLWSHVNPAHELRMKEIIEEEYPAFYLGNMPAVLSHEVAPKRGEYARAMTTLLNAYLHGSVADELFHAKDELKNRGFSRSLQMIHNTGGMADMATTSAVKTYNGGPIAGLIGALHVAKSYDVTNVITTSVGGTSFDLGLIVEGSNLFYDFVPTIDKWLVNVSMLQVAVIGAGGGSVAWTDRVTNRLQVGPHSAGAYPGPACYNLGGEQPTVTDADIILGYLNPDFFHGGKIKLSTRKAEAAIKRHIAEPLGVEVVEAASAIRGVADNNMGTTIFKETVLRGYDPRKFSMFVYGAAGPTHCAEYSLHAKPEKVVVMRNAPFFCAYGGSIMDIIHTYEHSKHVELTAPRTMNVTVDPEVFNSSVNDLTSLAERDIKSEGFNPSDLAFKLELDMKFGNQIHTLRIGSPCVTIRGETDVSAICDEFVRMYSKVFSPLAVHRPGGINVEGFALHAIITRERPLLKKQKPVTTKSESAIKGERKVFWKKHNDFSSTSLYALKKLGTGNVVTGPAIIEDDDTTVVVPPGRNCVIDEYQNLVIGNE